MLGRWPLLLHQVSLAKHTRDTVEILVSSILIQTGKPNEADLATNQAYTIAG